MKRRLLAVTAAMAVLAGAAACSDPTNTGTSGEGGTKTLNVYLYQKPKRFSPLDAFGGAETQVMSLIFDNLVTINADYGYEPRLAESWEITDGGATYTFKLRQGLKWSDGTPFTSKDVLFSFGIMANPKLSDGMSGRLAGVVGAKDFADGKATSISGFTAPDDNTFVIKLAAPDLGFLSSLALTPSFVVPEHILGKVDAAALKDDKFWNEPKVGMGPFTFVQYKTDQYVEVAKNPNYREPAQIDRIFLKTVTSDVAVAQLDTGEIDLAQVSATDLPTVQGMSTVTITTQSGGNGFVRIAVNQTQARFKDPRVRQAMLYAVDRKQFVEKSLGGKAGVPNSVLMGKFVTPDQNTYDYNPEKAKQLLKDAGWDSSKPVTLAYIPGTRDRDDFVTLFQSQLTAAGMKVELKQVQGAEIGELHTKATFDMTLFGGGQYAVDGSSAYPVVSCKAFAPGSGNVPRFCDAQEDALLEAAAKEQDPAKRDQLYQQSAKRDNEMVSYFWAYSPDTIWAANKKIGNFKGHGAFGYLFIDAPKWTIN